jgi:cysteine-rich repeat protein
VAHSNSTGVWTVIPASGANGPATVHLWNNTLHGNFTNLMMEGVSEFAVVNNSLSQPTLYHTRITTTGSGELAYNNVFGPGQTEGSPPVSNQTSHDPLYRDAARFDFRLAAGSLLVDAGTSSTVGVGTTYQSNPPTVDGDFTLRVAPHDIGAFEYSAVGNGVIDAGEQCDDGNRRPLDGCDVNGMIETLYVFQGPLYATDSACDCVYTVDNTGTKSPLRRLNAPAPASMATTDDGVLVIMDSQTGTLGTYDPESGQRRSLCTGLPSMAALAISPVALPGPGVTFPAGTLFGVNTHLVAINQRRCQWRTLGPVGPSGTEVIAGLDFHPDGTLFGAQLSPPGQTESLFTIDTVSGQGTAIGLIGGGVFDRVGSIVFDASGVPWVSDINATAPKVHRVNPQDASIILSIPLPTLPAGFPFSPQGLGIVRPED